MWFTYLEVDFLCNHQTFDTDPKFARFIVARFIRENHIFHNARVIGVESIGDAAGSFMHIKIAANTMSSAVIIVQTNVP